jgi:hypothetical protein
MQQSWPSWRHESCRRRLLPVCAALFPMSSACIPRGLAYRVGTLFDAKKTFQETLWTSGLEWTLIFTGGIFDYFFRIFGSLSA